jgi:uracil-DNA glycosylase
VAHAFDPGPVGEPYASLVRDYPGPDVYPTASFRTEWGPIFHRGRLDGTARVLVIGQDPAASEDITRRILVGEAGHRLQGFLAKLGIDRSYVMVNTFLYSVYGQQSGEHHHGDAGIVEYRNRWLDALVEHNPLEAVVALGHLADDAWSRWNHHAGAGAPALPYAHITHPTQPESASGGDPAKVAAATKAMLANWNEALQQLHSGVTNPDAQRPLELYGDAFTPGDKAEIPEEDLPPGLPAWMRSPSAWAQRTGATAADKRRTITVSIPSGGG